MPHISPTTAMLVVPAINGLSISKWGFPFCHTVGWNFETGSAYAKVWTTNRKIETEGSANANLEDLKSQFMQWKAIL